MFGSLILAVAAASGPSDAYTACILRDEIEALCALQERQRLLSDLGLEPLESLGGNDRAVRRAIFFDDYRNDMPVVEFRHDPGRPPRVSVVYDRYGHGQPRRLEVDVPLDFWGDVISAGEYFDRPLAPSPQPQLPDENGEVSGSICMHAWSAWVQANDEFNGAREAGASTCDDSLAVQYAYRLAAMATELLPQCASLEPESFGSSPRRLAACFALEGDTFTAGHLMNELEPEPFFHPRDDTTPVDITALLEWRSDFYIEWAGERIAGRDEVASFWLGKFVQDRAEVYELVHVGEAWNRVRTRGFVVLPDEPEDCPYGPAQVAPLDVEWTRSGDRWLIHGLVVGEFAVLPDQREC